MPDEQTGRSQERNHETFIHSRLVSHPPRTPSVDDLPVISICAVAGALVSFSYFVSQCVEDRIHENVLYYHHKQTIG
jgi:hypothetical protein